MTGARVVADAGDPLWQLREAAKATKPDRLNRLRRRRGPPSRSGNMISIAGADKWARAAMVNEAFQF